MKTALKKEYCKRMRVLLAGLVICSFGNYLGVIAGVAGTNGWNTLAIGLADVLGVNFGKSGLIISGVILIIGFLIKGKIGIGTLLNAVLLPVLAQVFLDVLPLASCSSQIAGTIVSVLGQFTFSVGCVFYMKSALGCGPRDTLMVVAGAKMQKLPIGAVKFIVESAALIAGIILGAPFGIGTLLTMAFQASILQIVCMAMKFEPRSVTHENLLDTYKRIKQ